jgi:hypothetical protein
MLEEDALEVGPELAGAPALAEAERLLAQGDRVGNVLAPERA